MKMHPITKPMLAAKIEHPEDLQFPLLATPKIDGIRCLKINGKAVSRKFIEIPNQHIRRYIEKNIPDGCDGEIVASNEISNFNETSGNVRNESVKVPFIYMIFDYVSNGLNEPYLFRMKKLSQLNLDSIYTKKILPVRIGDQVELIKYEDKMLRLGFEGVILLINVGVLLKERDGS
jgi:DNA ligase-1